MFKVTFIEHSGFLMELDHCYLLFDYWRGKLPNLKRQKALYVFSSHFHHDHYTNDIFKIEELCENVYFILSREIRNGTSAWKKARRVSFIRAHEKMDVGLCEIGTIKSNDEGIAYIVRAEGKTIYHSGDLHWWDWPAEPEEENLLMEKTFKEEMEKIKDIEFDAACMVLDPRQEESAGLGMEYFLENIRAKHVFPMHCWGQYEVIRQFRENHDYAMNARLINITGPGQEFVIE